MKEKLPHDEPPGRAVSCLGISNELNSLSTSNLFLHHARSMPYLSWQIYLVRCQDIHVMPASAAF
jgi:hypothetical protein